MGMLLVGYGTYPAPCQTQIIHYTHLAGLHGIAALLHLQLFQIHLFSSRTLRARTLRLSATFIPVLTYFILVRTY